MTTCLGKYCSIGLPRVPFINCCQLMYLVIFFWFWGQDVGSDCVGSWSLLIFLLSSRMSVHAILLVLFRGGSFLKTRAGYFPFNYFVILYTFASCVSIWASSRGYGTYHIGDQRRLRRGCASAQSHQSLRCSHTWSREVDEWSNQKSDV